MTTKTKIPLGLFYVDEEALASSDEDEFLNLLDLGVPPAQVKNPDVRSAYLKFLTEGNYDIPV